jgi:transposase
MAKTSRAEWAKRVERWKDSGLTAKEFAAELDVSPNSLTFWKWKLRQIPNVVSASRGESKRGRLKRDGAPAKFLQLVPTSESLPVMGTFELMMRSGLVLRIPRDFDESTLVRVVDLLGGR